LNGSVIIEKVMPPILPENLRPMFHGFLHEIRNPMSAVLTASTLLAEPELLEKNDFVDLLKVVDAETRHMNRVVCEFDRYLHLPPPNKEKFDVAAMMRALISDLQTNKILDKKTRVVDELPQKMMVKGDREQIGEAMQAVLSNASQALQDSVHSPLILALCPEESSSHVVFLIRDSGVGFTDESTRRAFEPFYSSLSGATGLGLPMALALLQNNGGNLEIVLSKKDVPGACLRVTLEK
jgi:nitrogen fixation/metabolism regulation signal transduction histidine kinase